MAANPLPKIIDLLFHMVEQIVQGLVALEAGLPEEYRFSARLLSALESAKKAEAAYQAGRAKWDGKTRPVKHSANKAVRDFIAKARDWLKFRLGGVWNSTWSEAGFISSSLAMPKTLPECASLLADMARFLAAHPEHENADLGVTAKKAEAIHRAFAAAAQDHNTQRASQKTLAAKRDAAVTTLRRRTRSAIQDLRDVFADNDPRWSALGLKAPADRTTTGTNEEPEASPVISLRPVDATGGTTPAASTAELSA